MDNRPNPSQQVQQVQIEARHRFLYSGLLVLLITLLALPLRARIEPTNLAMFYLLAVVVAAMRLGRGPAVFASLLGVLAFDLVFVPPYYTLGVADAEYLLTFVALLAVGLVISALTARAREQAQAAQRREAQTAVLYELSRELAAAADLDDVAQAVITDVQRILGGEVAVFVRDDGRLAVHSASSTYRLDGREVEAANRAYEEVQVVGHGTPVMSEAISVYFPLNAARQVVGVLGVSPARADEEMAREQRRLLESFASQAALAVERSLLAEEAREAQLHHETEKLQAALLNSISHDLRTPLATITGSLSSLRDDYALLDERARRELLDNAYEEAERLNRLVGNLLDMTRLEAGAMRISRELAEIEDVIGAALAQLANRLGDRPVLIDAPKGTPPAPVDFALMVQVFVNLLDNAHKYAPVDTAIEIRACSSGDDLLVEVADRGPGIPPEQLERVFDKFVRLQEMEDAAGTGLGLSISRGIVEAHGGRLWAHNREGGGAVLTVALPLRTDYEPMMEEAA
ncbi:MAG TPA: DUF4118 domain-containing protein [Candidatus Sulfomarinibacteraceae bacterium]|nr:DUF4118 domain-containing protein [Candidatus Sulfomarinibacteraceae bacterium]